MRNIVLTMAFVLLSAALTAQGVFSNKTQSILEKVIQDYPNHFYNIKGELISQGRQMSQYESTVQLPGSPHCMVVLTGGKGTTAGSEVYSWTCTVLDSESFEAARQRFHDLYSQLSNSIITFSAQKTFILSGQYEDPEAEKKVTHVVFSLLPGVGDMKRVKVGLSLHQIGESNKWKICISVSDRDNPDEEARGAVTVN